MALNIKYYDLNIDIVTVFNFGRWNQCFSKAEFKYS